ncbi:hypothetical protein AT277_07445 [Bacillus cereus]|nr:hypothetical protein AT277_07445 [Bacillus cereus]
MCKTTFLSCSAIYTERKLNIAYLNLLAYWLNFGGIIIWLISIVLLLVAAYFTKYIPISKKVH